MPYPEVNASKGRAKTGKDADFCACPLYNDAADAIFI